VKNKILFLTQDEPFYLPVYFEEILSRNSDQYEIIGIGSCPARVVGGNFFGTTLYLFDFYGLIIFSYLVYLRCKNFAADILTTIFSLDRRRRTVRGVAKRHNLRYLHFNDVNSHESNVSISSLQPDVIFSLACPQILKESTFKIPKKGSYNIHSSLLPKLRGINALFWALRFREPETGVTIHKINSTIDGGVIFLQEKIDISNIYSLDSLYSNVIKIGASMVCQFLNNVDHYKNTNTKNAPTECGSYYSFPRRKDRMAFKRAGNKFFRLF